MGHGVLKTQVIAIGVRTMLDKIGLIMILLAVTILTKGCVESSKALKGLNIDYGDSTGFIPL